MIITSARKRISRLRLGPLVGSGISCVTSGKSFYFYASRFPIFKMTSLNTVLCKLPDAHSGGDTLRAASERASRGRAGGEERGVTLSALRARPTLSSSRGLLSKGTPNLPSTSAELQKLCTAERHHSYWLRQVCLLFPGEQDGRDELSCLSGLPRCSSIESHQGQGGLSWRRQDLGQLPGWSRSVLIFKGT